MSEKLEIVTDDDGLTIIGNDADIDQFLLSANLGDGKARAVPIQQLRSAATAAGAAAQVGANLMENSGRWVRLTAESAAKVKQFGLTPTKVPGVSHAMIGQRGDIKSWLQIAQTPTTLLAGPFALSALGAMMQQRAVQEQMDEIAAYLKEIDEKIDDILRAQTDAVLADMVGIGLLVEEAMTVREHTGRVSNVTWSKVQGAAFTIARTQAYAIRQLGGIAEKLAEKRDLGDAARATRTAEARVREWLAVLARTMQLQDAVWVLELDRVLDGDPAEVEAHRAGLAAARANRVDVEGRTTVRFLTQMGSTVDRANAKVLLNPFDAPAAVRASNDVSAAVAHFQQRVGLESEHVESGARRWRTALAETSDSAVSSGVAGVRAVGRAGAQGIDQVTQPFRSVDIDGDGVPDRARDAVAAEQAGDALKDAASGVSGAFKTLFVRGGKRSESAENTANNDARPD